MSLAIWVGGDGGVGFCGSGGTELGFVCGFEFVGFIVVGMLVVV